MNRFEPIMFILILNCSVSVGGGGCPWLCGYQEWAGRYVPYSRWGRLQDQGVEMSMLNLEKRQQVLEEA